MNKDVRISPQEQKYHQKMGNRKPKKKKPKEASKGKTYRPRKKESRARHVKSNGFVWLLAEYGIPDPDNLASLIDTLIDHMRHGGLQEHDYARAIFDPKRKNLRGLAIGILDHKEETLPHDLVPSGDNLRKKLETHCRRMIVRNEHPALLGAVIEGWPGKGGWERKLNRHVDDLFNLYHADEGLYTALVAGQHGEVVHALRHHHIPTGIDRETLIEMLVIQGLLWCTNDIQLMVTRCLKANYNPMPSLISTNKRILHPSRVVSEFVPAWKALKEILRLYQPGELVSDENTRLPPELKSLGLEGLRKEILRLRSEGALDREALIPKVDKMMALIKRKIAKRGSHFREQLELAHEDRHKGNDFNSLWFGLSTVQSVAVPILRYVQAEQQLEAEVRYMIGEFDSEREVRESAALRPFPTGDLPDGWSERAKILLHGYRRRVLFDPALCASEDRHVRSTNAGQDSIKAAKEILQESGERLIGEDKGDGLCERRAFYLLDIIPEHRLALSVNMLVPSSS